MTALKNTALTRGILTILNLFEILPVYLVDRLLQVLETNTAYSVRFRGL